MFAIATLSHKGSLYATMAQADIKGEKRKTEKVAGGKTQTVYPEAYPLFPCLPLFFFTSFFPFFFRSFPIFFHAFSLSHFRSLSLSPSLSLCVCLNKTNFVRMQNDDSCMMSILLFSFTLN